jgi:hypothetical protein
MFSIMVAHLSRYTDQHRVYCPFDGMPLFFRTVVPSPMGLGLAFKAIVQIEEDRDVT